MTDRLPLFADLAGRACLVVGGGTVATRKVASLLQAGARVMVIAPSLDPELAARHDAGDIQWSARAFRPGEIGQSGAPWWFVVVATDHPTVNRAISAEADRGGIWCSQADRVDGAMVAFGAVARRGPITVAVSTGGRHPGAAAGLRDEVAGLIGPEYPEALDLLAEVAAATPAAAGRPNWRMVRDSGMLDALREGRRAEAKERLQACLSSSSD